MFQLHKKFTITKYAIFNFENLNIYIYFNENSGLIILEIDKTEFAE